MDQVNPPRAETSTSRSKELSRSRNRGSSRYTPPTSRSRAQDVSTNFVPGPRYRDRSRTTASTTVSTATNDGLRRRYRRPNRINSTVESVNANELDDSPIVRITQGSSRRNPSRSRSDGSDEETDKITNIRVFRKPTVNRELYDRTKYTRKRNNVEELVQKVNDELIGVDQLTVTADSVVESNTIQPIIVKPIEPNDETASNNKADYTSDRPEDAVATTTAHIEAYEFNPDLVTIVSTGRTVDVEKISEAPRKRKVLLRRRLVSSSTAADIIETEEERGLQVPRRRTTIKRKDNSSVEAALGKEKSSSFLLEITTPMRSDKSVEQSTASISQTGITLTSKNTEESTVATGLTGFTREMEDSTLTVTETTLPADFNADGFTKVTLETPATETTTISGEEATDILSTATTSTINTDEGRQSTIEIGTEATTMESTLATATVYNTENKFQEDTLIPSTEDLSTIGAQETITPSTIKAADSTAKSSFQSRYARKKFIRKGPASSSGNAINRYSSTSTENSSHEVLSRRRNSLFIRRNPVSSSTATTLRDHLTYQEEKEEEKEENAEDGLRDSTGQDVTEDTTLRSKSTNLGFSDDFVEFWKYYTTTSSRGHPSIPVEDIENHKVARTEDAKDDTYRSTSVATRGPEIRPRYKVPVILKRPFDPEEALSPRRYSPSDSASEESEETPETREARLRESALRQPRTRYKLRDGDNVKIEETTLPNTEFTSTWQYFKTRSYPKRPSTTTEATVTETLIPAKKFDYTADAFHRKQQLLRTTTPRSSDFLDSQNLIVPHYVRATTVKPSVTRLVTSVTESGTTERQKILIKTKYSSLTATTRIPADRFSPTTPLSVSVTGVDDDESANEIRQGVEQSTLPIEGEFNYRPDGRFTTESHESSTIEIESVFNNLIGGKGTAK